MISKAKTKRQGLPHTERQIARGDWNPLWPCRPNGRTQGRCSRLSCAFVCLGQPYGILALKGYQGRFSLRGSPCKGPRAGLTPANFPLPRRPADAFAGT